MARQRVILNAAGVRELLSSAGVQAELERRMAPVLAEARATAPVDSGDYQRSLRLWAEVHSGRSRRVAVHVGSDAEHALAVQATTGNLSRALDAAGGGA